MGENLNILITGIPGTGKTTIAKEIAKKLKLQYFSEKDFLQRRDYKTLEEYGADVKVVDLKGFAKSVNSVLSKTKLSKTKTKKGVVLDGLLFPYCISNLKIKLDSIFVLKLSEKEIFKRLKERKYPLVKIYDNLFVQDEMIFERELEKQIGKLRQKPKIVVVELSEIQYKNVAFLLLLIKG